MFRIYIVRNTVNGKIYIGKTKHTVAHRWREHYRAAFNDPRLHDLRFYRAIRKYGVGAFIPAEIDSTEDEREARLLEMAYIFMYQAGNPELGYNSSYGGEGGSLSEESKAKISASAKARGQWYIKRGLPHPRLGMKHREESKLLMSRSKEKYRKPPKPKKPRVSRKGWKHTPEALAKISEASKRPMLEATKQKLSAARTGEGNPMYGRRGTSHPRFHQRVTTEQVVELRSAGMNIKAISKKLGVSRHVVYNRLGIKWN